MRCHLRSCLRTFTLEDLVTTKSFCVLINSSGMIRFIPVFRQFFKVLLMVKAPSYSNDSKTAFLKPKAFTN